MVLTVVVQDSRRSSIDDPLNGTAECALRAETCISVRSADTWGGLDPEWMSSNVEVEIDCITNLDTQCRVVPTDIARKGVSNEAVGNEVILMGGGLNSSNSEDDQSTNNHNSIHCFCFC
jgi:hypothetical protein